MTAAHTLKGKYEVNKLFQLDQYKGGHTMYNDSCADMTHLHVVKYRKCTFKIFNHDCYHFYCFPKFENDLPTLNAKMR